MFFYAQKLIQLLLFGILASQVLAAPTPLNDDSAISKRDNTPFEISMDEYTNLGMWMGQAKSRGHPYFPSQTWTGQKLKDNMVLAARRGYEDIKSQSGGSNPPVIVAALHVPSHGIFMATSPQKSMILSEAQKTAPIWWKKAGKDKKTSNDLHAEDGAIWFSEYRGKFAGQNEKFPQGSFIAAYGRYGPNSGGPDARKPCGDDTTSNVSCQTTLRELGIASVLSDENEC